MRIRVVVRKFAFAALLLLASCSRITQDNFNRIQDGMSEQEVQALLGPPTSSSSVQVIGISGTSSTWEAGDIAITVRFLNGKVALKNFEKTAAKK
jgi:SmpA / OmlA family